MNQQTSFNTNTKQIPKSSIGNLEQTLQNLNEKQREAVLYTNGPLLVLAGAGSGKTRVITNRFVYLVKKKKVGINQILAITFTNKAALEVKERVSDLLDENAKIYWIRTFHSVGMMILRKHCEVLGYKPDFEIYNDTKSKNLIKNITKELKINNRAFPVENITKALFRAKDDLISFSEYDNDENPKLGEIVRRVYKSYQEQLLTNQAIDFSDLIVLPIKLLKEHPEIRKYYHNMWKYVMIDEFQDTNLAQYKFMQLITSDKNNLCVVGDDDQAIYEWRGAVAGNIFKFKNDYNPHSVFLEQNYRSSSIILEAANNISSKIPNRMPKSLWTNQKGTEKIKLIEVDTSRKEADVIANEIENLFQQSEESDEELNYQDIAIFYRVNYQSHLLEHALKQHGIPYKVIGMPDFYNRKEIKDVFAYIALIVDPTKEEFLRRIINVPQRGIGTKTLNLFINFAKHYKLDYIQSLLHANHIKNISKKAKQNMMKLGKILNVLNKASGLASPHDIVKILIETIDYKKYVFQFDGNGQERYENVKELLKQVFNYQNFHTKAKLIDFVNEVNNEIANVNKGVQNGQFVSLMTIHNSKGLEFPIVFVTGVVDGIIPLNNKQTLPNQQSSEERRLFYVAVTRAKKTLYLSWYQIKFQNGKSENCEPSPFLKDIPDNLSEFIVKTDQKSSLFA